MRTLALLLVFATALAAQTIDHAIGSAGASLTLGKGWRKHTFAADFGGDQFEAGPGFRLFGDGEGVRCRVREVQHVLENDVDYAREFAASWSIGDKVPFAVTAEAGWTRISRRFDEDGSGYRSDLWIRGGLAYEVLVWADDSEQRALDRRIEELRKGLVWPAADSAYAKAHGSHTYRYVIGDLAIEFDCPLDILQERPATQGYRGVWRSGDGEHWLQVTDCAGAASADAFAEQLQRTTQGWMRGYTLQTSRRVELGGLTCIDVVGSDGTHTAREFAVPLAGQRWFLLRYYAPGGPDDPRPARDALLAHLRVARVAPALDLPPVPDVAQADAGEASAPPSATAAFVATGSLVGAFGGDVYGAAWLGGGRVAAWDWQTLRVLDGDGKEQVVTFGGTRTVFAHGDATLVVGADGAHRLADGGVSTVIEHAAQAGASLGGGVLLVRPSAPLPIGLGGGEVGCEVVRCAAAGAESVLLRLPHATLQGFAVDGAGAHALLGLREAAFGDEAVVRLCVLTIADGALVRGPVWQIEAIATGGEGCVVTGAPEGGPRGIYAVDAALHAEALITGEGATGLFADADTLVVRADREVRRIALPACRERGARCAPFGLALLERIGAELIASGPAPRTAEEVLQARRRADEFARAAAGVPLPATLADVLALVGAVGAGQVSPPQRSARCLLAVLFAAALLAEGGIWVDGATADWTAWHVRSEEPADLPFADLVAPVARIAANCDDSEGWAIDSGLSGRPANRPLLVGLDRAAMGAHARALMPPGFADALARHDAAALAAVLAAHPGDRFLRAAVYRHLAEDAAHAAIVELARPFATGAQPTAIDCIAWAGAWQAAGAAPDAAGALFDGLLAAARREPGDAGICYWLGRAAQVAFPQEPAKARFCYDRVLAIRDNYTFRNAATAALAALPPP